MQVFPLENTAYTTLYTSTINYTPHNYTHLVYILHKITPKNFFRHRYKILI